jgi:HEAT repeat protein
MSMQNMGVSAFLILFCAIFSAGQSATEGMARNDETAIARAATIKARIVSIMQATLKLGEFTTADGIKAYTKVPPSSESIEEVRKLGNGAIPVLASYIDSSSPREQELAMRFLVAFDGERIVHALGNFATHSAYPTSRAEAVLFLEDAPSSKALPIVQEVLRTDSDPYVRKTAAEFLAKHSSPNP